ncbi:MULTISPECIES: IclR family transcriptional regulator [unclassified Nonomuraea]|uniref:IclR family transcriptional regulator n=1 Tax=unclassified Nonomuraea TaxID=2593643 RepID=UPI00191C2940|nr:MULTISPECIES: IclR family transcriptional regulator [unclassified Nonomuraea]
MSVMVNDQPTQVRPTSANGGRMTAPALRRGLDILELFLDSSEGLRVPEITARLGLPRASVHELVGALVDRGYLKANSDDHPSSYSLGVKVLQLGGAYEQALDMAALGRKIAKSVAAESGETVQVAVRDGRLAVYVVRVDSRHAVRLVSSVGSRLAAHCTAGGKMLLSALDDDELDALYPDDDSVEPMTQRSIDSKARLLSGLAEIRRRGWSEEFCESNDDAACVAAPVFDAHGTCVAAMSITVPTIRWNEATRERNLDLVREGARALSRELGASGKHV